MRHTQRSSRSSVSRAIGALVAASVVLTPLALAAETAATSTTAIVAAVNTLSITGGSDLSLTPTIGGDVTDTTTLAFDTNDGVTYSITLVATEWVFEAATVGSTSNTFPVLRFVSSTADGGTPSATPGVLIDAANAVQAPVPVVTEITSVSGSATVTLEASITQTVVAGSYATTLTYSLVVP